MHVYGKGEADDDHKCYHKQRPKSRGCQKRCCKEGKSKASASPASSSCPRPNLAPEPPKAAVFCPTTLHLKLPRPPLMAVPPMQGPSQDLQEVWRGGGLPLMMGGPMNVHINGISERNVNYTGSRIVPSLFEKRIQHPRCWVGPPQSWRCQEGPRWLSTK